MFLISFFLSLINISFANLYITTEYFDLDYKKSIITKHHLFLNQPYDLKYSKILFKLNLVKVSPEKIRIEHEEYKRLPLEKIFISGGSVTGNLKSSFVIDKLKEKELPFKLIIKPEKVVPTKN